MAERIRQSGERRKNVVLECEVGGGETGGRERALLLQSFGGGAGFGVFIKVDLNIFFIAGCQ